MTIGDLIRQSREASGWDQAELAKMVHVGQQTVSRWERSETVPSANNVRALAKLFQKDPNEWQAAGGNLPAKRAPKMANYSIPHLPVVTLIPHLPLQSLAPENFELFHVALLQALHPTAEIHREGKQGHTQNGIDISVRLEDGSVHVFQCKRVANFGPAKIKQAIEANRTSASEYFLCLSRIASPDARREISKHANWHLWDGEDISFEVKKLDRDIAGRLVEIYFGGPTRAAFLGLAAPGPWITAEEYFRPYENTDRTFSHGWPLVGHSKEIDMTIQSLLDNANPIVVLSSPGGTGKTRFIKEIANRVEVEHRGYSVRFASPGLEITPSDLDSIPLGKTLLIFDDAHDREDLGILLHCIAYIRSDITLLITSRPYHDQKIRLDAGSLNFQPIFRTIRPLTLEEHAQLSREILRSLGGDEALADRIAQMTKDSPLATSIGSSLVAKRTIAPEFLANEEDFQRKILERFEDVILGSIAYTNESDSHRQLFQLLALLQPISIEHPEYRSSFENVLSRPWDVIYRGIRTLRDAGVLIQRGSMLRIVPDLLSDYIVADTCIDSVTGSPTEYADRIFNLISGDLVSHLLINLAKLDWRLSARPVPSKSLLSNIWNVIYDRFNAGDSESRTRLMLMAGTVGYFQPGQVLRLAKMMAHLSTTSDGETNSSNMRGYGKPELAQRALTIMLKNAAYGASADATVLAEICDQLWELGRCDARALNQTPEHPIRILNELASITPGKPLKFNEQILANALSWLPTARNDDAYSVFDAIDSLLATDGFETESSIRENHFKPYRIVPSVVAPLRMQIVDVALRQLSSSSIKRALQAAALLENAIRGPIGMFGQTVTPEDTNVWKPHFQEVLNRILREVEHTPMDPFVHVRLLQSVNWHLKYANDLDVKNVAKQISNAMPRDARFTVSEAFVNPWNIEEDEDNEHEGGLAPSNPLRILANELVAQFRPEDLAHLILERLTVFQEISYLRHGEPNFLIGELVEVLPSLGMTLASLALDFPDEPVATILSPVLASLARNKPDEALAFATRALQFDVPHFNFQVSFAYGRGLGRGRILSEKEIRMIESLAKHPEVGVRINALGSLRQIHEQDPERALDLILQCNVGDSEKLAAEALSNFGRHGIFQPAAISVLKLQNLLDQLLSVHSIEQFEMGRALQTIANIYPDIVVNFLIERVRRSSYEDPLIFRAIPFMWESHNLLDLRSAPHFQDYLRRIRNLTLDPELPTTSWAINRDISNLFSLVAVDFSVPVLEVLKEWVESSDAQRLTQVAQLMRNAPNTLIFDEFPFIETFLMSAYALGTKTFREVAGALQSAATMGSRSGHPGQPFSRDLEQRDMATDFSNKSSVGSPVKAFYESLIASANQNIERSQILDELDEGFQ